MFCRTAIFPFCETNEWRRCRSGGELGAFTSGDMVPAFSKAAFALKVGEMSDLVDSDSGLHLILRLA